MCNKSTTDLKTHRKLQFKKKHIVCDTDSSMALFSLVYLLSLKSTYKNMLKAFLYLNLFPFKKQQTNF